MNIRIFAVLIGGLVSGCGFEIGTHAEVTDAQKARSMLIRVVADMQLDPPAALQKFTAGTDGFKDGNIYPFCFDVKSGVVKSGQTAGRDIRTFADGAGQIMFDHAQKPDGEMTEVAYKAPKPGPDRTPVKKITVVTRVGEFGCGVGYYPPE